MLKRAGVVETWSFRQIEAGDDWKQRIDERLNASSIILLLVSSSFLASDYCWNIEMKRALERHDAGEATVIPVILKDCDWRSAPFSKLQALPEGAKPVAHWRPRDRAWSNVVAGIRSIVESHARPEGAVSVAAASVAAPLPVIERTVFSDPVTPGDDELRDDLAVLAGQLRQFLAARSASHNAQFGGPHTPHDAYLDMQEMAMGTMGKRAHQKSAMKDQHCATTLREYGDQFGPRVLKIGRLLRSRGEGVVADSISRYPSAIADLHSIVQDLERVSAKPVWSDGRRAQLPSHELAFQQLASKNEHLEQQIALLHARQPAPRRLSPNQIQSIARSLAEGVAELDNAWSAEERATFPADRTDIAILIVMIGDEKETIDYHADFVRAFQSAGLYVVSEQWTAGARESRSFAGRITLLEAERQGNVLRPVVLRALTGASVGLCEAPSPQIRHGQRQFLDGQAATRIAAQLVVGQRGSDEDAALFSSSWV